MPAAARKTPDVPVDAPRTAAAEALPAGKAVSDAAPAEVSPDDGAAAAPAPHETPEPQAAPATGGVALVFRGAARTAVAGVGLVEPGQTVPVPAADVEKLCRGDDPLFTKAAAQD